MSFVRMVLLSMRRFLGDILAESGLGNVAIVDGFPEDDRVVTPKTAKGVSGEVVLPAISIEEAGVNNARRIAIGESGVMGNYVFVLFIHALSRGQELDIRTSIVNALADNAVPVYDYSNGYPGNGGEEVVSREAFSDIRHRSVSLPGTENTILKYAGAIDFVVGAVRIQ